MWFQLSERGIIGKMSSEMIRALIGCIYYSRQIPEQGGPDTFRRQEFPPLGCNVVCSTHSAVLLNHNMNSSNVESFLLSRSYYNTVKNMIDVATKLGGALGNEAMKGTVE